MHKIRLLSLTVSIFLLVGCGTQPAGDLSASPTTTVDVTLTPPPLMVTSGMLTLVISSPKDGATVMYPQVEVLGSVSTDAVLTIRGERQILPPGGFSLLVELEPGVNELVFAASSLLGGNEVELTLIITYQP